MCAYTCPFCVLYKIPCWHEGEPTAHQLNYAWNLLHDKHESKSLYSVRSLLTHFRWKPAGQHWICGENIIHNTELLYKLKLNGNKTRKREIRVISFTDAAHCWKLSHLTLTKKGNTFLNSMGMKKWFYNMYCHHCGAANFFQAYYTYNDTICMF